MSLHVSLLIYVRIWLEATRAVGSEWGFMMKCSVNLKFPIIEPESWKKMEKRKGREVGKRTKYVKETETEEG